MTREGAAGWHGKLPTVSDFASRRLDARFIDLWDSWISAGLANLRANDAEGWMDAYLAAPTWRFLVAPGFLPAPFQAGAWAGVVMPSVDRVGRYYPLTLAAPLQQVPPGASAQEALWGWLHRLEDIAMDALDEDWSIDVLENELFRLGLPPAGGDSHPGSATNATRSFAEFFAAVDWPCCVWHGQIGGEPVVFRSRGFHDSISGLWAT